MRHMADNEDNTFIAILSKTKLLKIFVMTGVFSKHLAAAVIRQRFTIP